MATYNELKMHEQFYHRFLKVVGISLAHLAVVVVIVLAVITH